MLEEAVGLTAPGDTLRLAAEAFDETGQLAARWAYH